MGPTRASVSLHSLPPQPAGGPGCSAGRSLARSAWAWTLEGGRGSGGLPLACTGSGCALPSWQCALAVRVQSVTESLHREPGRAPPREAPPAHRAAEIPASEELEVLRCQEAGAECKNKERMPASSQGGDMALRLTPFQQRCFALVRTIPCGKVSTYGDVAKALGSCARAVGQAMRRNPLAPSTGA